MKLFKFYILATLTLILTSLALAAILIVHQFEEPSTSGPPLFVQWATFLESAFQLIVTFGPLSVALYFRERRWVCNMFVYTAIAGTLSFLASAPYISDFLYDFIPSGAWLFVGRTTVIISAIGIVAFLSGCYCIKDKRIRNGFRWVGNAYLFSVLVGVATVIFRIEHMPIFQSPAIPHLSQIPENIVFLTLLRRIQHVSPVRKQWEAAVASIGTPEN